MARILTGIQSTNIPHLGNILGAIMPAIELSKKSTVPELFLLFQDIDLHSLQSTDYESSIVQELLNFGYKKDQIISGRKKFFQSLKTRIESGFFHIPFSCLNSYFDNNLVKI